MATALEFNALDTTMLFDRDALELSGEYLGIGSAIPFGAADAPENLGFGTGGWGFCPFGNAIAATDMFDGDAVEAIIFEEDDLPRTQAVIFKEGHTRPIPIRIKSNGVAIPFSSVQALYLRVEDEHSGAEMMDRELPLANVFDSAGGGIYWIPQGDELTECGQFRAEVRAVYNDGTTEYLPNSGCVYLRVEPHLHDYEI